MRIISSKSELNGTVRMPGSKSHTIRAVALASLAQGSSTIHKPLVSLDTLSAVNSYRMLGADIDISDSAQWLVKGFSASPSVPDNVIDVGNSGTSLRMAVGTAGLLDKGYAVFTGDEQIRRRPSGPLLASINELGGFARSTRENDLPPFIVAGRLKGGKTQIKATSSQYFSALLVNCPFGDGQTKIEVLLLNEKPYVEMTLSWLDRVGLRYENHNFERFIIPGSQKINGFDVVIPADFSSATFFLCAAALAGRDVRIEGLDMNDTQGDKAVVDYLRAMGAKIDITDEAIIVSADKLVGVELDLNATPDALPAMAVVACCAQGKTKLYNVAQARIKETDRLAVMAKELSKLGAEIKELPDGLEISQSELKGGRVDGNDDHRVVMALALAGLVSDEPVIIEGAESAAVTFPNFVELMNKLGADIHTEQ